jgi:RNA polymerase sigma-70 factor, ECF subfamily
MSSEVMMCFPDALVHLSEDNPKTTASPINAVRDNTSSSATIFESDEILLVQAGLGSKEALSVLFRRYRPIVSNVASRILRDPSEAEDVCQEVFLSLFEKI